MSILPGIEAAARRDIPVFLTSQHHGSVDQAAYESTAHLANNGVLLLKSMSPSTAIVKLMWCLGQTHAPERIRQLMLLDVAGETVA